MNKTKSKLKHLEKQSVQKQFEFDVALSFAGEDRRYVHQVAQHLVEMGYKPFYDKNEQVNLWGKDLYQHLSQVYSQRAKYTVIFISKYYAKKNWTNHELKSAQSRAFNEHSNCLLPARFDKTEIPGVLPTIGYIDLKKIKPKKFAELIKSKLGPIYRKDFFPKEVDMLAKVMGAKKKNEINRINFLSYTFFRSFSLLSEEERVILSMAAMYGCDGGPPDDVHIELPYLSRLLDIDENYILLSLSRINSLGFEFEIAKAKEAKKGKTTKVNKHTSDVLHIKYIDPGSNENASDIYNSIFQCFAHFYCENCRVKNAIDNDFSILSTVAGFPET